MKKAFLIFGIISAAAIGCKGYLGVSGTVSDEDGSDPLKSVTVTVINKKGDPTGKAKTDSAGQFNASGAAPAAAGTYRVIFVKKGYKTDTVEIKKGRGLSVVNCDHSMKKKER